MTEITGKMQAFISAYIRSAEQLEILLLLQATPHKNWTVSEMSCLLLMDSPCVSAHLHTFAANAIVVAQEEEKGWRYRFEPVNSEIAETIATLAKIYSHHKRRIRTLINES